MPDLIFEAKRENLDEVLDFINVELLRFDCADEVKTKINIVVEEIFVNISSYAYDELGKVDVSCNVNEDNLQVEIKFKDSGKQYNPLEHIEPDISLPIEQRNIGGLGIFMSKKFMDDIEYEYKEGKNILTIRKIIKKEKEVK